MQLSVAAAQANDAEAQSAETQYRAHIQRALQEYGLGHWSEARAFFVRAHEITPNARTLRGMGLASYEMRDYVAAIRYLQEARSDQRQPLSDTMRTEAERQIEEAQSFIAHCILSVEPPDASIKIDGEPANVDADGTLMINPGDRELSLEADGYEPVKRTLTVNGGDRPKLHYALRRIEPTPLAVTRNSSLPPSAAVSSSTERADAPGFFSLTPLKVVGLALAGGAVVAAGVGTGFSIAALNDRSASNRDCDATGCGPSGLEHRERALSRADVATVSFASAGALLLAGALTFVLAPNRERRRPSVAFAPLLDVRSAGITAGGAF